MTATKETSVKTHGLLKPVHHGRTQSSLGWSVRETPAPKLSKATGLFNATQGEVTNRPCPDLQPTMVLLKHPQIPNTALKGR